MGLLDIDQYSLYIIRMSFVKSIESYKYKLYSIDLTNDRDLAKSNLPSRIA